MHIELSTQSQRRRPKSDETSTRVAPSCTLLLPACAPATCSSRATRTHVLPRLTRSHHAAPGAQGVHAPGSCVRRCCAARAGRQGASRRVRAAHREGCVRRCVCCRTPAVAHVTHTGAAAAAAARALNDQRDPLLFQAQRRDDSGRIPSAKLRKLGRTPAVVFNQACSSARRLHALASSLRSSYMPLSRTVRRE